jgi:hypothetical protein
MAQHRHQRDDARAAANQLERPTVAHLPDEVPPDRTPKLERVAHSQLADEIGRHLTIRQPLHREHQPILFRRRRDRVAPLGLVSVLGRQPNVYVLTRSMSGPARHVEDECANVRSLVDQVDDLAQRPVQSPQYRCSRHGSPYRW